MADSHSTSRTDLATRLGVTPQTLRNWQREALIPAPRRVAANRVEFTPAQVLLITAVAEARHAG